MEIKLEQIRAFGPSILKVRIPDKLVDQLNQYVDQVIIDEKNLRNLIMEKGWSPMLSKNL